MENIIAKADCCSKHQYEKSMSISNVFLTGIGVKQMAFRTNENDSLFEMQYNISQHNQIQLFYIFRFWQNRNSFYNIFFHQFSALCFMVSWSNKKYNKIIGWNHCVITQQCSSEDITSVGNSDILRRYLATIIIIYNDATIVMFVVNEKSVFITINLFRCKYVVAGNIIQIITNTT